MSQSVCCVGFRRLTPRGYEWSILARGDSIGSVYRLNHRFGPSQKGDNTMPAPLEQYNLPQPKDYPSWPPPPPHLGVRETTRNLGLYNPYLDKGKKRNSFAWALVCLVFAVIGLTVVGLMVLGVGLGGAV